ncbi:MAG: hypothetical protein AABX84_02850 [Nanoarchaeota archaeon]
MTKSLYEITGKFGKDSEKGFVSYNSESFDEALRYAKELGLLSVDKLVIKKFILRKEVEIETNHKILDIQTREYIAT